MKDGLPVLVAVTILFGGCQAHDTVILLNDNVAKAVSRYADAASKKHAPIEFDSGDRADTCESYVRLAAKSTLKEDVVNQLGKSEYLVCDVLAIVGNRKVVTDKVGKAGRYGTALASQLDLRSFPSSLFPMLDENRYTLVQLDANAVNTTNTSATSETTDWRYRLELVAISDIDKNGKPDWVLWLSDESKSGNYRGYQTLIAYNVKHGSTINAKPYQHRQ